MRSGGRSYWKSETSIEKIIGFEGQIPRPYGGTGQAGRLFCRAGTTGPPPAFTYFDLLVVVRFPRCAVT
jgi:hypothetical protein